MINKITGSAVQGIQKNFTSMRKAADEIASATRLNKTESTSGADLARSLVQLKQAQTNTAANVKTLKTADQMIGTLLDVRA